jgi:hypothetical protein
LKVLLHLMLLLRLSAEPALCAVMLSCPLKPLLLLPLLLRPQPSPTLTALLMLLLLPRPGKMLQRIRL